MDLDVQDRVDRRAILCGGTKAPFLESIDGILIETKTKLTYQSNHIDRPILTYNCFEQDCSLESRFPGFFGILRADLIQKFWCDDTTRNVVDALAASTAFTFDSAWTVP